MKKISIIKRNADNNDHEFWKTRTPEERLSAVEILREQYYAICGYTTIPRIIRELHLVDHAK